LLFISFFAKSLKAYNAFFNITITESSFLDAKILVNILAQQVKFIFLKTITNFAIFLLKAVLKIIKETIVKD